MVKGVYVSGWAANEENAARVSFDVNLNRLAVSYLLTPDEALEVADMLVKAAGKAVQNGLA